MNAQEAITLHTQFLELIKLVAQKVPQSITRPHPWIGDSVVSYGLTSVDLVELRAHYSLYVGCGEYEYESEDIDLSTLFGA